MRSLHSNAFSLQSQRISEDTAYAYGESRRRFFSGGAAAPPAGRDTELGSEHETAQEAKPEAKRQMCSNGGCPRQAVDVCGQCRAPHCQAHLSFCDACGRGEYCDICVIPISHICIPDREPPQPGDTGRYLAGRKSATDCASSQFRSRASPQVQNRARVPSHRTRRRGLTTRGGGAAEDDHGADGPTAPDGGRPPPATGKGKKPRGRGRGGGRGKM